MIAYSRTKKTEVIDLGIKYVDFTELLSTADIVSIHTPLNSSTKKLSQLLWATGQTQ